MSIRKIFSVVILSAEVMALSACSNDPSSSVIGAPKAVEPPSSTPAPSVVHDKGFIWSVGDGLTVIPTPPYAESMHLTGINNLGQVVGYVTLHDGQADDRGFIWSANDGLQRLGSLVGPDGISWPLSIDDNGEVRGLSEGPSTRDNGLGVYLNDRFVWSAASGIKPATSPVSDSRKLTLPPGTDCTNVVRATSVGFAVGYAGSGEDGLFCKAKYAVMWDVDGTPVVIGQPCGTRSCDLTLSDVNNRGEVVGSYAGARGFRWTRSGGIVEVPLESGSLNVINDNGDAAGIVDTGAATKPFVWTASGEIETIELPSATYGYPVAINNRGQVIGAFR